jgi:hypothetical protein
VILKDFPLYIICFISYSLHYYFTVLCACFNDNMSWGGSILVKSVWCTGGFLYLNGKNFLRFGKLLCYWIYYISLWLALLLLQCSWFTSLVFW